MKKRNVESKAKGKGGQRQAHEGGPPRVLVGGKCKCKQKIIVSMGRSVSPKRSPCFLGNASLLIQDYI